MQSGEHFLVGLGEGRFFRSADGNLITTTLAPSDGFYMTYNAATTLVARLRSRGFRNALVTDLAGEPATYERLQQYRRELTPETPVAENLPATRDDLDRMSVADFRRRYTTEPAFKERAEMLEAQPRQTRTRSRLV